MAVRGAAAALLLVALALSSLGTPSAALDFFARKTKQPPRVSTPGDPKNPPHGGKFTTVVTNRYHKRDYEITCATDWGASCYIKCPARCPNKCLAYCAYCLTFCRQYFDHLLPHLLQLSSSSCSLF